MRLKKIAFFTVLCSFFALNASAWTDFSKGMWYQEGVLPGNSVLITYSGYRVYEAGAKNWADALMYKSGAKHVFAIVGPQDAMYSAKEMSSGNDLIVRKLLALNPDKIIIAAHSSGTYVAHELLGKLATIIGLTDKTRYYDLDGVYCYVCDTIKKTSPWFKVKCVGVSQGTIFSPNRGGMQKCGGDFVDIAVNTACSSPWCLHGYVINERVDKVFVPKAPAETYYADAEIIPCVEWLGY